MRTGGRKDGQTRNLIVAIRNFLNAPKNLTDPIKGKSISAHRKHRRPAFVEVKIIMTCPLQEGLSSSSVLVHFSEPLPILYRGVHK
jgi:hypothetical protein